MSRRLVLATLLAGAGLLLSGCFNRSADEQSVPWGRPAEWEDNAPGMGGF